MAIQGDLAQIYAGLPVQVKECKIAITQPNIRDICAFGEDNFLASIQLFTRIEVIVSPVKEGNSRLAMLDDFQVLLIILDEDNMTKSQILAFFSLIFPDYIVRFDPGSISFLVEGEKRIVGQINPMNFEFFQKMLNNVFLPKGSDTEVDYNPANDAAAKIAEKLKEGNKKRQQMALEKEKDAGGSLFSNYVSILSVGLSMSINMLLDYTPFQLYDTFTRYTTKLAYDLYQKVSTTPMMDTSKMTEPKNWMDNLY